MSVHLELHALHSLPPSNPNRDDLGSPKTATYGGVPRARVSSQSWKRAMREHFATAGLIPADDLSARTRQGIGLLTDAVLKKRPELGDTAAEVAETVLNFATGATTDTAASRRKTTVAAAPATRETLFLGHRQITRLAELAAAGAEDIDAFLKTKENAAAARAAASSRDAIDIALFGRMIATGDNLTVDAAVQVAHALAVHRTPVETDFFSAVDDLTRDSGAGMIGRREFVSPTLYRYAVLTGPDLASNLAEYAGAMSHEKVTAAFVRAFAEAMPSGHITSYAHTTRPTALLATVTATTPLNLVGAFETPIETNGGGHLGPAAARLAVHLAHTNSAYGDPTAQTWLLTTDPTATAPLHDHATLITSLSEFTKTCAAELERRTREHTSRAQA
ncbi:type I-E CRISPR-associated protein Cas7/Cse4/CasC [Streptomyces sp. NPDC056056]|uniref:type I-E CRISPR-associated protein Cas7/Cse4/CasC n=1 Tax=Streptomyces sp. NPDC056056 TaxID=3345698 RepID=UPI0035E380F4